MMCDGGSKEGQVRRACRTMVSVTLLPLLVLVAAADCCYLFPSGKHADIWAGHRIRSESSAKILPIWPCLSIHVLVVYLTFVPKININCWSPHTYLRYLSNVMLHNKIVWRCGVQTSRIRVVVWPAGRVRCAGPRPMAARTTASAPRRAPATATTRARDHSAQATPETTLATVRCAELRANQIQI